MFENQMYQTDQRMSQVRAQNADQEIRNYQDQFNPRVIFSRKLYSKLLIQMVVIALFIFMVYKFEQLDKFLEETQWLFWVALAICIGATTYCLLFRQSCQKSPLNWILFIIFTLSAAYICGVMVALGNSEIGLLVFSSLASMIFFLFLYSLTVKKRLTYQGSILFLSASILIVFELFTIFTKVSLFWLIMISLGSFLFAFLLIYDTNTNVNSGDQFDVSIADDVSGSVVIYWDIVLLFLKMNELIKDYLFRDRN